jgi:ATP-dependent DNA helicase RecG
MEGTQQSGIGFTPKIANLGRDGEILQHARNQASDILDDDPKLQKEENRILVHQLLKMKNTEFNWSSIS